MKFTGIAFLSTNWWKHLAIGCVSLFLLPLGASQACAKYTGPGPELVTVEQAKQMGDDAKVTIRGFLIQHLGGKHYLFEDDTGTITVEISEKRWQGLEVGPDDLVEIHGEVDKDFSKIEIEVKRITKP